MAPIETVDAPRIDPLPETLAESASCDKPLIVMATYNEIENLPGLVDSINQYVPQADILVIDDNSPDGTGRWCDQRSQEDPRLHCLHREKKLGLGTATIAGLRRAVEGGYDYAVMMDADFSHHPRYLPAMLAGMGHPPEDQIDVMIGSRYVAGGGIEGWPLKRHLMSKGVNFFSRWMLGIPARDCSGSYRCYRCQLLGQLDFDGMLSHGYSVEEEILWRLKQRGARFGETPIVFVDREKGQSKIDLGESLSALSILMRLAVRNLLGRKS